MMDRTQLEARQRAMRERKPRPPRRPRVRRGHVVCRKGMWRIRFYSNKRGQVRKLLLDIELAPFSDTYPSLDSVQPLADEVRNRNPLTQQNNVVISHP